MTHPLCRWQRTSKIEKGILVGCDLDQEWLLEWWWERYSAENAFPVTFADFGMSEQAKAWCTRHGELITVDIDTFFIKPISAAYKKKWGIIYGHSLEQKRHNWFKKPFACLMSHYKYTIWIDLDCEILNSLDDLFSCCMNMSQVGLVREMEKDHLPRWNPGVFYNGGVIAFVHGCDLMVQWAEGCIMRNDEFCFDDNILSVLINEQQLDILELPVEYNWKFLWGINMNAIIIHWATNLGKNFIKNHGGIKRDLQKLFANKK